MIQRNSLLVCLLCGVVAACAPPPRPSQSSPVATTAVAPELVAAADTQSTDASQQVICKSYTPTGTRFQKNVCGTQAQWDKLREDGRDFGDSAQRKGVQTNNPQGN